jgi:uncharacterized GH25 family protein
MRSCVSDFSDIYLPISHFFVLLHISEDNYLNNFEISIQKTKNITFCGKWPVRSILILDNQPTDQVSRFNYPRYQLSYQGEVDVDHKLEKFNYTCGTIKRTLKYKTGMETQIKFYQVMAVSAPLYGSENWILAEKDQNKIQAAEMRFLRATSGVTRQDRLTNEAIRKTLKVDNLNDTISKYRDNWFNHFTHMDHSHFQR